MKAKFLTGCRYVAAFLLAIAVSGCSLLPGGKDKSPEPTAPSLSEVVEVSEDYYGSITPYKPNQTRGMLSSARYRIDFSHLELGLMEFARDAFPTSQYYFQEGQVVKKEQVTRWIAQEKASGTKGQQKNGILVHVLEHDYLNKKDKQLAGMVLGLSVSPNYQDATGKEMVYTQQELQAKGQQLAASIVATLRVSTPNVPMLILLYQVPEANSSLVPGHFIMSGTVGASESAVSKWQPIEEEFFLFPSADIEKKYPQQSLQYDKLLRQAQAYFGEYVGMTGVGRFMDGRLTELTITATAEYDSRTEVLQFTQYAAGSINQLFDKSVHVNLYVQSMNKPLAIYIRPTSGEPYMHLYRQ
ncbi:protein involved in sex pheromone biosynthesis [Brevibacillus parabrevis]|uniref:CamS family sex pheromone protein n=1 Tax=Brevibacillus parabrevis TaxID=54914 RepID=UPI0007ABF513|nr:CamS family sex pheromone protein [Brevibacillus parabrevis]KZE47910.1 protein involved in sex pheromone biosynthesis [Brevibacillus parabrevis]